MAIYHFRAKIIGKRRGPSIDPRAPSLRSPVAAAAYRSGERLYDVQQGKWYEYTKPDVVHSEVIAPDVPGVGDWVKDRAALWNMVVRGEFTAEGRPRVNAQFAREFELTLPRELSPQQRVELVHKFLRERFVSQGMVVDFSIHNPIGVDGFEQPHAHCMATLRRLDPTTASGFAKNKARDWNETEEVAKECAAARKQYNNTNLPEDKAAMDAAEAKRNINVWRKAWAEAANQALAEAGSAARIDHRTLEKQGIFRLPQISLGIAKHIERAYDHIKERVTQWVGIKKRASLYEEVERYKARDPVKLTQLLDNLNDIAENFTAQFRKPPERDPPGVGYDR